MCLIILLSLYSRNGGKTTLAVVVKGGGITNNFTPTDNSMMEATLHYGTYRKMLISSPILIVRLSNFLRNIIFVFVIIVRPPHFRIIQNQVKLYLGLRTRMLQLRFERFIACLQLKKFNLKECKNRADDDTV